MGLWDSGVWDSSFWDVDEGSIQMTITIDNDDSGFTVEVTQQG